MKKVQDGYKYGTVIRRYIPTVLKNDVNTILGYNQLLAFDISTEGKKIKIIVKQDDAYSNIYKDDKVKVIKYKYIFDDFLEMKNFLADEISLNNPELTDEEKRNMLNQLMPSNNSFEENNYSITKYDIEGVD